MLRRAKIDNETVGVTGKTVKSSHNIEVVADITIDELNISNADAIVLPGGMPGTLNLEASPDVLGAVDYCADNNRYIAAICAAPSIIGHKGLLDGRYATCFPGYEKDLKGAIHSARLVAVDGKFITAKRAGCSMKFALKLVELLVSKEKAEVLESGMQSK